MEDVPDHVQLVVIGGGVGGYAAAFRAADLGLDVILVSEEERLGGVCLLRGCIPSKAMLEVAELLITAREAKQRGIHFGDPEIKLDELRDWKDGVVTQLVKGLQGLAERRGVRVVQARATFQGSDRLQLEAGEDQHELAFDNAVIATGSRPVSLPDTEFEKRIISSAGALELSEIPQRLLVVGGGYVGLELGTVYASLGSKVTLVEMTDRLLAGADQDLVKPLAKRVEELFDGVYLNTSVTELEESDDQVRVEFDGEETPDETTYDQVLVAVGRRPNSENLGLENTEVELDDNDFIRVDDRRCTTDDRISAIGDVVGGMLLAHEAMHEGIVAVEAIAGQEGASYDVRAVPAVVYTDPQVAWCGLTEEAAEKQDRKIRVTRFPWRASGRAVTLGASEGITKLLTDPESGRILGVGIVGREAESLIAQGVLAIEMGAVAEDIAHSIAAHPTVSETIHEAAQAALNRPLHMAPEGNS